MQQVFKVLLKGGTIDLFQIYKSGIYEEYVVVICDTCATNNVCYTCA